MRCVGVGSGGRAQLWSDPHSECKVGSSARLEGDKSPLFVFSIGRACLRTKLQSNSLRPLKRANPQAEFLFLSVPLPDPAPGSCPRLPPLLRETFPPHDLIRNLPSPGPGPLTSNSSASETPEAKSEGVSASPPLSEAQWRAGLGR